MNLNHRQRRLREEGDLFVRQRNVRRQVPREEERVVTRSHPLYLATRISEGTAAAEELLSDEERNKG